MRIEGHRLLAGKCAVVHILLHLCQGLLHFICQVVQSNRYLLVGIAAHQNGLSCLNILRADLHTQRNALHLAVRELVARSAVGIIYLHTEGGQSLLHILRSGKDAFLLHLNRNDHHLGGRHIRRKNQSVVIAVHHDDGADHAGGHAPGCLVDILEFIVFVQVLDLKSSRKAFAEVVAGAALQGLAVVHQCLDGVGCLGAGELFLIGLLAAHHRNRQILLREIRVDVQHQLGSLLGILIGCMSGVSLLP